MADITTFTLSKEASDIAEEFKRKGQFDDGITAARFAAAYVLKNHFDEFDPETYEVPNSGGSNYNIGSVDPDNSLSTLIKAVYPDTDTPYTYIRKLMVYGLLKIDERMKEEGITTVAELCR